MFKYIINNGDTLKSNDISLFRIKADLNLNISEIASDKSQFSDRIKNYKDALKKENNPKKIEDLNFKIECLEYAVENLDKEEKYFNLILNSLVEK